MSKRISITMDAPVWVRETWAVDVPDDFDVTDEAALFELVLDGSADFVDQDELGAIDGLDRQLVSAGPVE